MEWWEWVTWGVTTAIAIAAFLLSVVNAIRASRAERRAAKADARLERIERLERVQFEIRRAPNAPGLFGLVNTGTDAVEGIEIDPTSVLSVTFRGSLSRSCLEPTERHTFMLEAPDKHTKLPASLRITWTHPYEGERRVPLPTDPDEPWSAAVLG